MTILLFGISDVCSISSKLIRAVLRIHDILDIPKHCVYTPMPSITYMKISTECSYLLWLERSRTFGG